MKTAWLFALAINGSVLFASPVHPFTVRDEIGIAHFDDLKNGDLDTGAPLWSPDGKYAAIKTERGLLDQNRPEDELRIYQVEDLRRLLKQPPGAPAPRPVRAIKLASAKQGPIINQVQWLGDSSGVAFLGMTDSGNSQLWLAEVGKAAATPLTPLEQDVVSFDVRDRTHFGYTVRDPEFMREAALRRSGSAFVGTGRSLIELLYPPEQNEWVRLRLFTRCVLWAAQGGRPFPVRDSASGEPIVLHPVGLRDLALSPDGRTLAIAMPVANIPKEWPTRFRAPPGIITEGISAGPQDVRAADGVKLVRAFVTIDLVSGHVAEIIGAPTAMSAQWFASGDMPILWSRDGGSLLLPGTFLANPAGHLSPPWICLVDVPSGKVHTLERLEPYTGNYSWRHYLNARFEGKNSDRLVLEYNLAYGPIQAATFVRLPNGDWAAGSDLRDGAGGPPAMELSVRQGLNEPPVLVASNPGSGLARAVWDPNPQLKDVKLTEASIYRWKDIQGHDWIAGLYKPDDYAAGRRYPIVIQNHGFYADMFKPSGIYPTAFAARALAAAGIMVLQVQDGPIRQTPDEGPSQVLGYESAVRKLDAEGLIDPSRMGIIGYSRTGYYVMRALTASSLRFKAASVTSFTDMGYFQHVAFADYGGGDIVHDGEAVIGAAPIGPGLQLWLQRSPEFNLDKVSAPLQVVVAGPRSLLDGWGTYSTLRLLKKPVDLLLLNSDEHILTNPGVRLASQGGTVDWFRFWLQDYEDPDPAKADQYERWEGLRALQKACEGSAHGGH